MEPNYNPGGETGQKNNNPAARTIAVYQLSTGWETGSSLPRIKGRLNSKKKTRGDGFDGRPVLVKNLLVTKLAGKGDL